MKKNFFFVLISLFLLFVVSSGFAPFSFWGGTNSPILLNNGMLLGTQTEGSSGSPQSVNTVSAYTFAQTTGTYTPAYGGTVLCTSLCDDGYFSGITIPFSFTFNGTAYTTVSIQENGWLQMGTTTPSGYTPLCSGSYPNVISPFARDLDGNSGVDTLRYLTIGTTPNRVFIVEWWHWGFYSGQTNQLDFQVQLYETSNVIKFVYNPETPATTDGSIGVGLLGATTADFISRTSTTSWTASTAGVTNCDYMTFSSSIYPSAGLTFTWTPGVPVSLPTVVTTTPVATGSSSATSGGNVTDQGSSSVTARGVCWNTTANPTISNSHTSDGTGTGAYTSYLTGLTSGTLYHVRAYATNTSGTSYGSDLTFTTCTGTAFPFNDGFETTTLPSFPCGWTIPTTGNPATYTGSQTYGRAPHSGVNYAAFYYNSTQKWAITPGIPLSSGTTYSFSMWYITDGYSGWTNLSAYYNTVASATGMIAITGATVSGPVNTTYTQMTGTFTPTTTGIYYIGITCTDNGVPYYLSFDDISVFAPTNMSYVSSTTTQNTLGVLPNSTNNQIIGMQVVTNGTLNPISISNFKLTTTGSTNPTTDIRNAKVFYTGISPVFSTSTQYGTVVTNPNGSFNITGAQTLSQGSNYFWLSYDIPSGATNGNYVDATCDSISGTTPMGTVQPVPPNPTGSRQIVGAMSGNYTIGSGMTYPNFNIAIADLNARGVSGPVTFLVKPGIFGTNAGTEIDSTINISTGSVAGVSSVNTVTFKKKSDEVGDVWVERGGTAATNDYVIGLLGAKYTTFDSINIRQKDTALGNNNLEWGYYVTNPTSTIGSQYNTIRNCKIYMKATNANTTGIYHYYTVVPYNAAGTNSNNTYQNNTIVNAYKGIYAYGYASPAPYILYDRNTQIIGNTFLIGGGGLSSYAYGVYTYYQGNGLKILNNYVATQPNTLYYTECIYLYYGYDANIDVSGNTINFNYFNAAYTYYGIYTYYAGATSSAPISPNRVNINNNTFAGSFGTGFASTFYGIYPYYSSADTLNIVGNTFANDTLTNSNSYYFIYPYYWGNVLNVYNNTVNNIYNSGSAYFYPIYAYYSYFNKAKQYIHDNTISNMRSTGGYYNYGIYSSPATTDYSYIYNNTISNNFTGTGYAIYGIFCANAMYNYVYNNKINNLKDSAYTSGAVYGIYSSSGTNNYYYNNFISNLKATSSTSNLATIGIYVAGGTYNGIYNNSIYLADTGTSTSYGSNGIYLSSTYSIDVRNNNIVNISKPGNGTYAAKTCVLRIGSSTYLPYYLGTSGNNNYYTNPADTGSVIYFDAANRDFTLQSFKNRVNPRDQSSVSVMPSFVSAASGDLHINPATPTLLWNGAYPVTTPISVSNDIDNNVRSTPYCDIGAHEFAGSMPTDIVPPTITYTTLGIGNTSNRAFNNITVTDPSGVNSTTNAPRVYYKKSTQANTFNDNTSATDGWKYAVGTLSGSVFNFTINYSLLLGGTVSAGDIIQYFVVAQDNATTPNVGINAGAFTTLPTSVALIAGNFPLLGTINQYSIITSGVSGTVNVGTGQTYTSLTKAGGLFNAINTGVLSGNLNVVITSDLTEDGTYQLQNWAEQTAPATYKITIRPDGTTIRNIYGWVSNTNGMIRLYGVNNVTIDGSFGGSGRYLRFGNWYVGAGYPTVQFYGGCTYDTLKNCILEGNNSSTSSGVVLIGAAYTTVPQQANNYLTISGNLISSRRDSLIATANYNGICNYGSAAPLPLNSYNNIINNEIKNFLYYGIYVSATGSGDGWVVKNNSLYYLQDAYTPAYVGATMYCIYVVPGVYGSGYTVDSNYVGGSQALAGGSYMNIQGMLNGIYTSYGFNSQSSQRGNVFKNIRSTYLTANTTTFFGIACAGGWHTNSGNTVGSSDTAQRIQLNGLFRGIYSTSSFFSGAATITCSYNTINNLWTRPDSTVATITASINRYALVLGGYIPADCSNNNIQNILCWQGPGATTYNVFTMGILPNNYSASTIRNNYIYNVANLSTATPTSTGRNLVYGMQPIGMGDGSVFSGNKISHIYTSTLNSSGDLAFGIYNAGEYYGSSITIANNQITLLDNSGSYANVCGVIDVSGSYYGGVTNWYDNTIVLGGTAGTGNPYSSYAYYKSTTSTYPCVTNMRNNVLYNMRTGNINNAATGLLSGTKDNSDKYPSAVADENMKQQVIQKPVTKNLKSNVKDKTIIPGKDSGPGMAGSSQFTSDYNVFITANTNIVGDWYGSFYNLAGWQTNSTGDLNSIADTIANISAANMFRNYTNGDLNIDTTKYGAAYVYKNGIGLTGITNDFNGYPRATSGSVNIGSHEFALNGNTRVTLLTPVNNATSVARPVSMVWNKALFSTGYRIIIASDSLFSTIVINTNVTDSVYSFTTGLPATSYWWKVNPVYTGVNGLNSTTFKFTTVAIDPTAMVQANFNAVTIPQIMSCGGTTRMPVVVRATVTGLNPNALYRYYNGGAAYTDIGTTGYGAGNPMFMNPDSLVYKYTSSVSLTTAGGYDVFRTNGSGTYTGWFCYVNTANARFAAGKYSIPSICLGDSNGVTLKRFALNDSIKVVNFSSTAADTCGTGVYGISVAFPRNVVSIYDNTAGTGKPLAQTYLEVEGVTVASIAPFYTTYVEGLNGHWGAVIPNLNANGVKRVEQRSLTSPGTLMTFNTDADGIWPSGANTVNPTGGLTPVGLLINDAPLLDYPVLVSPPNNATGQPVNLTLKWNNVTYASSYRVQLASDSLFTTIIKDSTLVPDSLYVSGLTSSHSYWWKVAGITTTGAAPFGGAFKFTTVASSLSLNMKAYLEGFWDGATQIVDTVNIYLASSTTYALLDSQKVVLGSAGTVSPSFSRVSSGNYYIVVKHRNHLETWSALPQTFVAGTPLSYDFTTDSTKAFGMNMKKVGSVWVLIVGDANQDGSIDASDVTDCLIPQYGYTGYLSCDFNGDGSVDASDIPYMIANYGLAKVVPSEPLLPPEIKLQKRANKLQELDKLLIKKTKKTNNNNNN